MKYVGVTVRDFKTRTAEHLRGNNTYFDKTLKEQGIENFEYEILQENVQTVDLLNALEIAYILFYGAKYPNGYNLTDGGNVTTGYRHTAESRKKMSKSRKGTFLGEENPFYGKTHDKETRKRMSEAWTPERKAKLAKQSRNLDKTYMQVRVRNADTGKEFDSVKECAEFYGLKATHISRVCRGKRNKTGGYKFEYIDKSKGNPVPSPE